MTQTLNRAKPIINLFNDGLIDQVDMHLTVAGRRRFARIPVANAKEILRGLPLYAIDDTDVKPEGFQVYEDGDNRGITVVEHYPRKRWIVINAE